MKLYNTIKKEKEEFIPLNKNEVKIYSCGPTVYNYFHIGNARMFTIFDILRTYLEYIGYKVTYVQNFTDIDDKMIRKANSLGVSVKELADKFIDEYYIDARALGIKDPTIAPKATENITDIIEFIKKLEDLGYAYDIDGDVYFDVQKFKEYGKLSGQNMDDLEMGARIDIEDKKKNPMDFALWKSKKPNEPSWESPWSEGRPGWHIECSVMATKFLGETIDIHCGGQDLIFPHHENEVAQSEAVSGKPFANYWVHNGFINIDNHKMSKSKGNFFTVRDILKKYNPEIIRFFLLTAHYRKPINFSEDMLAQAKKGLERMYTCLSSIKFAYKSSTNGEIDIGMKKGTEKARTEFKRAMDDDLNTADAIAAIFDLVKETNNYLNTDNKTIETLILIENTLHEIGDVLGILRKEDEGIDNIIESLIEKRQDARKNKDWKLSDNIRDELLNMDIILEDTKDGVKWRKK